MSVHVVEHPVVQDALVELRDGRTPPGRFRCLTKRMSLLLAAEALRGLSLVPTTVDTPNGRADGRVLRDDIVVVPILRAGLGMLDAVLELAPEARVGYVGLRRDETTAVTSQYFENLPHNLADSFVLLVDPMLATGGSALRALDIVARAGAVNCCLVCILAAPEGIEAVTRHTPSIEIFTAVIDRHLDARFYIVPGLGDFGDRLYGTSSGPAPGAPPLSLHHE